MDSHNNSSIKVDVYSIVTNRIIELLERGTIPWQQPWTDAGIPMNLISKRPYRGINFWLLLSLNYERNLFLTWDQLKKLGGSVNQGEHGHVVVYWKTQAKSNGSEEETQEKKRPILRYYKVFNVAQCRDLPVPEAEPKTEREYNPILECEAVLHEMPMCPPIKHKEQQAYYDIKEDVINMPKRKSFKSVELYYATLFHELVHSTGSEKRLNRKSITEMAEFGSDLYSIEELVAELGSAYLTYYTEIQNKIGLQNSAAYINGWLEKLKSDKRFIIQASGHAQKAVDYIFTQTEISADPKDEIEQSELLTED